MICQLMYVQTINAVSFSFHVLEWIIHFDMCGFYQRKKTTLIVKLVRLNLCNPFCFESSAHLKKKDNAPKLVRLHFSVICELAKKRKKKKFFRAACKIAISFFPLPLSNQHTIRNFNQAVYRDKVTLWQADSPLQSNIADLQQRP